MEWLSGWLVYCLLAYSGLTVTASSKRTVQQFIEQLETAIDAFKDNAKSDTHTNKTSYVTEESNFTNLESVYEHVTELESDIRDITGIVLNALKDEKSMLRSVDARTKRELREINTTLQTTVETNTQLMSAVALSVSQLEVDIRDVHYHIDNQTQEVVSELQKEFQSNANELKLCLQGFADISKQLDEVNNKLTDMDMHMCTINLALGKETFQSSLYHNNAGWRSGNGVDGNTAGSFFHTNADNPSWWMVDLGRDYSIGRVVLYNRIDCCGHLLENFEVLISDTKDSGYQVFASRRTKSYNGEVITLTRYPKIVGRFVKLQQRNILHLQEIMVFYS